MSEHSTSEPGKFSTFLALTSLGLGTLILLVHLSNPNEIRYYVLGFFYVIVTVILNGMMLAHLFYHFVINRLKREIIAIRMLILLANIPIALLYFNIVFKNKF